MNEPLKISNMFGEPKPESFAYRFDCFTCKFFRTPILGGILVDGKTQKKWFCTLVDVERTKCRFDSQEASAKEAPRQTKKIDFTRLPDYQDSNPQLQPQLPSQNLSGPPQLHSPSSQKPAPTLPRLPVMEGRGGRTGISEHK